MRHRLFFSPPLKPKDEGLGVSEDTGDFLLRVEARESIDVSKSLTFGHAFFITLFLACLQPLNPLPY
jgi:hypothetical protein